MARKKGSKRARLFVGGSLWGSRGSFKIDQEAIDNIKKGALLAKQDVKPASGAQSARDFAPVVEGAGTQYVPKEQELRALKSLQNAAEDPRNTDPKGVRAAVEPPLSNATIQSSSNATESISNSTEEARRNDSSVQFAAAAAQNEAFLQEQEAKGRGAGWAPPNSGINTMANVTIPPGFQAQIGRVGLEPNVPLDAEGIPTTTTGGTSGGTTVTPQAPAGAPVGVGFGRPDAAVVPQQEASLLEAGPESQTFQMEAQTPLEASQAKVGLAKAGMSKVAQAKAPAEVNAATMEAAAAEAAPAMEAATGQVSEEALAAVDAGTITQPAVAAKRDAAAEQAAMAQAAQRPEARDYAEAVTGGVAAQVADIQGPAVITREGATISKAEVERLGQIAQGRGINLQDLPEYKDVIQKRVAQQGEAATAQYRDMLGQAPEAQAAQAQFIEAGPTPEMAATQIGTFEDLEPARREAYTTLGVSAPEAAQMESVRQAQAASRQAITASSSPQAIAEQTDLDKLPTFGLVSQRTAQVAEAAQGIAQQLSGQPAVDLEGRQAILGEAPRGDAAQIGGIPTAQAASMQAVTGQSRKMAAADMATVVVEMPPEVTAALTEDPAVVEAQLDTGADPEVPAAIAALPEEALVSTQMEGLLAGLEDGQTPAWARPAVAAIEQQMAQRGLSASTVGRDALFNAIIQSALPIAQSNAQALQQRASQNLSNEQQANLAQSQQIANLRLQNLSNRQTAASQTAQMAQQIKVQAGEFRQQAGMLTAQQEQQTRITQAQFEQQQAQQESAQRQQAAVQNLSAAQQMDLANLQAINAAAGQNLSAEQQSRLATYQAQINRTMRQAELKQDMEKANLSTGLQVELANLSEQNAAARDTMTAQNQER
jgi:hypothetical protein